MSDSNEICLEISKAFTEKSLEELLQNPLSKPLADFWEKTLKNLMRESPTGFFFFLKKKIGRIPQAIPDEIY